MSGCIYFWGYNDFYISIFLYEYYMYSNDIIYIYILFGATYKVYILYLLTYIHLCMSSITKKYQSNFNLYANRIVGLISDDRGFCRYDNTRFSPGGPHRNKRNRHRTCRSRNTQRAFRLLRPLRDWEILYNNDGARLIWNSGYSILVEYVKEVYHDG